MKFFKSATEKLVSKEVEYKLHEKVLRDLANDKKDLGIWGKAFVDADGDEQKAKAIYITLMVQHYKDTTKSEAELEAIWNENYQREQAEKEEMLRQAQKEKDEMLRQTQKEKDVDTKEKSDLILIGISVWIGFTVLFMLYYRFYI